MDSNLPPPYHPPPLPSGAPPVIAPQQSSPPPKRGGRGWKIAAIIMLVLLVVSLFVTVSLLLDGFLTAPGQHAHAGGPKLEEVMFEDHDAVNKIAVIEVNGLITSELTEGGFNMVEVIKAQLKRAKTEPKVRAVILKVDSPGGEVLASDEIYRLIADFQKESKKPVVASMGSLAASGGYYVSAPCQWIVANEMTITGSIGVIMQSWNYRGLMNKVGVAPMVYKSGKFKDMLSGSRNPEEIPPEERQMVQKLIDETFATFKGVVAKGRDLAQQRNQDEGRKLNQDWESYADGRVLSGNEAYKLGFVDELGNFDTAVERALKLARIAEANLVRYELRLNFADIFRIFGETGARARVIKVDLGIETPKLQAGQLYFLSPTVLH